MGSRSNENDGMRSKDPIEGKAPGKTVVLTGGGTAGHIYPALALAAELKDRGYEIFYAGTPNGIESRIVPDAGIAFKGFTASGFNRSHPISLLTGIARVSKSTKEATKWFNTIQPDAVVGFGGYVSIPVTRAAERAKIPTIVHEQNSVMGMANKYIAEKAQAVCLTYEEAAEALPKGKDWTLTGNPVRSEVTEATREEGRSYLDIPEDATVLLVFGGSKGARHINEAIATMKDELLAIPDLYVYHITGESEKESVESKLALTEDQKRRYRVAAYENRMPLALAAADFVVSRAGATSLAEIAARAIPAVLIPYPYATGNHQMVNARSYATGGAAIVIPDSQIPSKDFSDAILGLAQSKERRDVMHAAASARNETNATCQLADIVEAAIASKK